MIAFEQEPFEAWLFSLDRNRLINAADPDNCYICSFFREAINYTVSCTWSSFYKFKPNDVGFEITQLPLWIMRLVDPIWVCNNAEGKTADISAGKLQDRYIELFGDPRTKPEPETVTAEVREEVCV